MKVALEGDRIVVSALVDLKDAGKLLKRLQANIDLLEAAAGADSESSEQAQISLMITQTQREALRQMGFENDQIANMTPGNAHRLLSIKE